MKLIRVAATVLNQTPMSWRGNLANILAAIDEARDAGVQILCLPEMCVTGYGCEDAYHSLDLQETALELLGDIVAQTRGMVVSVGLPILHQNALFNCACLICDSSIRGFVAKRHLAGEGIHYEPRWFKPWPEGVVAELELDGNSYPLGDIFFECGDVKIGFEICEDAWVARRPGGDLSLQGVDIILNPSASHFAFEKFGVRRRFVLEGSRAFGVSYVHTNLLGNESGRIVFDGGTVIASDGRLLAQGPRFSFADRCLTSAIIDVDATRMNRARTGSFQPDLDGDPSDRCVEIDFTLSECEPSSEELAAPAWEASENLKEEEFTRAISLALFDYLRKSRSGGFVVSLSGGADSSAVACLVALMVKLGTDELGIRSFLDKLGHLSAVQEAANCDDIVRKLLACVYQATRNSSDTTRNAARTVAQAIGAVLYEFEIDDLVDGYTKMVSSAVGRPFTWDTDDVALQNIQARARAPGVWMLANLRNSLLLATSNRSEAAVGYATMDGDTCGGLSPIAGIDKAFLRSWLRWLESDGPEGVPAIPELSVVNVQAPTAELRPLESGQLDEDDLMPYPVLDAIERAAIRDKQSPVEIYKVMKASFPQFEDASLAFWVERFFKLWCRNQWKRERYAPSFHVDDENLDPKTWCRFPILSGGYERELEKLRQFVAQE